jgi:hypothetical protein
MLRFLPFLLLLALPALAQTRMPSLQEKILLPDGPKVERPGEREERQAALKIDQELNLRDAARIMDLMKGLEKELQETQAGKMPPTALGKISDIEKMLKDMKKRIRRI